MASSSIPRSSKGNSVLMELATFIEEAREKAGTISLPKTILKAVKNSHPNETEINALVQAIEAADTAICGRLDGMSLVVLCKVLFESESCLAQQRGLCLIAESLYHGQSISAEDEASRKFKTTLMGQHALITLIKGFINPEKPDESRRWMGVLALELLEDRAKNAATLQSDPDRLRALSGIIKHGRCQVLKLVAGSIIRKMLNYGVSPEEIWLTKTDRELYSQFPRSDHQDMQWIVAFERFVDELVLGGVLTQERSDVLFAFGLAVGGIVYNTEDESAILVTVAEELRIVISASPTGPARYVDVPLKNIQQVAIESILNAESQSPRYGVRIQLLQAIENAYYVNAVAHSGDSISLAFTSEKHARTLVDLIQPKEIRTNGGSIVMESQPIDCSEALSDDELTGCNPPSVDSQILVDTALRAKLVLNMDSQPENLRLRRIDQAATSQIQTSKEATKSNLETEIHENALRIGSTVSQATEGINVSLPDTASTGRPGAKADHDAVGSEDPVDGQPTARSGALGHVRERVSHSIEHTSDAGLSRSSQRQPGPNAIRTAPQAADPATKRTQDRPQQEAASAYPYQDYGSSNSISPRAAETTPRSNSSDMHTHPTHTKASMTEKEVDRPLATVNGMMGKPQPPKLSSNLRNDDGEVEMANLSSPPVDVNAAAKNIRKKNAKSNASKTSKASVSAKAKGKIQVPQPARKAKEDKGKAKPPQSEDVDHLEDQWDLPQSSERSEPQPGGSKTPINRTLPGLNRTSHLAKKSRALARAAADPSAQSTRDSQHDAKHHSKSKAPPESRSRPIRSTKDSTAKDLSIWDLGLDESNDDHNTLPPRSEKGKATKTKSAQISKVEKSKTSQTKPNKVKTKVLAKQPTKARPPPAALSKPRPRRAAALIANKKIHGLEESDGIIDEAEGEASDIQKKSTTTINKQDGQAGLAEAPKRTQPRNSQRGEPSISDNHTKRIQPHRVDATSSRPEEGAISEAGCPEKIDLVPSASRQNVARNDIALVHRLSGTDLMPASEVSSHGAEEEQLSAIDDNIQPANRVKKVGDAEEVFVPDSVPMEPGVLPETENVSRIEPAMQVDEELEQIAMVGDAEDSHFQEAMPYRESIELSETIRFKKETIIASENGNTKPAPSPKGRSDHREQRGKIHSVQKPSRYLNQASSKAVGANTGTATSRARDPFEAKLRLLVSDDEEGISAKAKQPADSRSPQAPKASKKSEGRPYKGNQSKDLDKDKQAKSTGKLVQGMHNAPKHSRLRENVPLSVASDRTKQLQEEPEPTEQVYSVQQEEVGCPQRKNGRVGKHDVSEIYQSSPSRQSIPLPGLAKLERDDDVGRNRQQQASSRSDFPRLPGATIEDKRPVVQSGRAKGKEPKPAHINVDQAPVHQAQKGGKNSVGGATAASEKPRPTTAALSETPLPNIKRKPEIISFSAKGPRNQGIASNKKPKPLNLPTAIQADTLEVVAIKPENLFKSKARPFVDDPVPCEYEQPAKRQKRDDTPTTKHEHVPRMVAEPILMAVQEKPHRVSSQSTRVNENGSPMPTMRALKDSFAATQGGKDGEEVAEAHMDELDVDDDPLVTHDDIYDHWEEPTLPFAKIPPQPHCKDVSLERLSSNSKQQPSSPHAPSAYSTMPAHHVYHDGKIFNPQTRENIIPEEPQDPFIGTGRITASAFINALRMRSDTKTRHENNVINKQKTTVNLKRRFPAYTEDPDQTLVEPEPPRKQTKYDIVSITSSSSTSSEDPSPSHAAPSQMSDVDTLARWRKAFEPHQSNMLDVLSHITHRLVRHLVDEETAIRDMVKDFATGGNNLIDMYEKERQEAIALNSAQLGNLRRQLVSALEEKQVRLAKISEEMGKRPISDVEKQWKLEQERLMNAAKAVLADCA